MFERLNTPQEAYNYKLGAALTMEQTVLKILQSSIGEAKDERVAGLLRHHLEETEGHVRNLQEVFGLMGWEVDDSPCPAIDGIQAEAKANAKKTHDALVDAVLLQGSVEVEHHEIAVYENLIINARAMGRDDVVNLLQRNLESELHTLEEVKRLEEQVAAVTPKHPAGGGEDGVMDKVKGAISG
jgi:ferritin-like metal-binding protein YciE